MENGQRTKVMDVDVPSSSGGTFKLVKRVPDDSSVGYSNVYIEYKVDNMPEDARQMTAYLAQQGCELKSYLTVAASSASCTRRAPRYVANMRLFGYSSSITIRLTTRTARLSWKLALTKVCMWRLS